MKGKAVVRVAGIVLTIASIAFLLSRLASNVTDLPPIDWRPAAIVALVAAIAAVVLIEVVHSFGWRTLVRAIRPEFTWRTSFSICGRSQIGKYLPGNIFHYAQRVTLAAEQGIESKLAIASVTIDSVLVLAAGCLVAVPGLLSVGVEHLPMALSRSLLAVGIAAAAAIVAVGILWRRRTLRDFIERAMPLLSPARLAIALAIAIVPFLIAGVSVQLVVDGFWPGQSQLGWLDYTWGFALAFVVGFVTPGSPGGIGVRDAVLFALYQQQLGPALAASLSLATRVVYILGDLATFCVASLVRRTE